MKLKALKPRLYNAMFHTHTVSGIVISFALFICFYAGAISLFREELYRWENPKARFETLDKIDLDETLNLIKNYGENSTIEFTRFNIKPPTKRNPYIQCYYSAKTKEGKKINSSYFINPHTKEFLVEPNSFRSSKSLTYMADTIYRLHYFRQIPVIGMYLAGLVAFFFLFAIVTGVLVHWKNIVNKFYNFNVQGKWKQIWVNSHTVLGIIVLPFQFIYAITGALMGISILLLAPSAFLLFGGDTNEVVKLVSPNAAIKYDKCAENIISKTTFNELYNKVQAKYPRHEIERIVASNYGKQDGTILFRIDDKKGLASNGELLYRYKDGILIGEVKPSEKSYTKGAYGVLIKLHYANYGGYLLKVIYFILSMITCYIITSGVMIWKTARDNSKYTDKQKHFHHKITKVYLAFTLSLFPSIALIFIANKATPMTLDYRVVYVKAIFFIGWLLLTSIGLFENSYKKLNRNYLFIGSILGLCVPVINGIVTSDWFWETLINNQYYIFSVDLTWTLIGLFGLLICNYLHNKNNVKPKAFI